MLNLEFIEKFYTELPEKIRLLRESINRPLTLSQKILYLHTQSIKPTKSLPLEVSFDQITQSDATQLALIQFAASGKKRSALPVAIFCDHLIVAEKGEKQDLLSAQQENSEIYEFLQNASLKYHFDFWKVGSGIGHQLSLEHYAFPGGLLLTSDPYAVTGSLGMLSFEGSATEILDAMLGFPKQMSLPKVIGIHLTGKLKEWTAAKDVALKLLSLLKREQAEGTILEYFGEGCQSLSCYDKSTICSMSGEMGVLSSIFPYDSSMSAFLKAMGRNEVAAWAESMQTHLNADDEVLQNPIAYYHQILDVDLSTIEPYISGPHQSDPLQTLTELAANLPSQNSPSEISMAFIGSSTNCSYADFLRVALIARQAIKHGLKLKCPLMIALGSEQIAATLEREGYLKVLQDIGATFLVKGCGPCIGQWKRMDVPFGEKNCLLTTGNHNHLGHFDANPGTHAYIASPETVIAMAFAGTLTFNPGKDTLLNAQGLPVKLFCAQKPFSSNESFEPLNECTLTSAQEETAYSLPLFPSDSEKIQMIEPFPPPTDKTFSDLRVLVKVDGKCTIDQISPQGKWLKHRNNLKQLSNSLFSLVPNGFRVELGKGKNLLTGTLEPFSKIAGDYKKEGIGWIAIGLDHFGEGPLNEYAALSMRYLGGKAVIAKSIPLAFELNLKRQGILTLHFIKSEDQAKIREDDLIDILNVDQLSPSTTPELLLKHADGTTERVTLTHTYEDSQFSWFKAGSALNAIFDI